MGGKKHQRQSTDGKKAALQPSVMRKYHSDWLVLIIAVCYVPALS